MNTSAARKQIVLVSVLKRKRDLAILLNERWYRIPEAYAPKRKFRYLAFYQPAFFGRQGKRIRYYARITSRRSVKRLDLLPDEPLHPRANEQYAWLKTGRIQTLPHPIKNTTPRRVSFGFTTLERLLHSKNILELYNVPKTEEIIAQALKQAGIAATPQQYVSCGADRKKSRRRYYLDFAVWCRGGKIAIECDNAKAHAGARRRKKDKMKDANLRQCGWTVIRLTEPEILSDTDACVKKIARAIKNKGGLLTDPFHASISR